MRKATVKKKKGERRMRGVTGNPCHSAVCKTTKKITPKGMKRT